MLDLSYAAARPFLMPHTESLTIVQVGAGGTGSWLYPHLVRLVRVLQQRRRRVQLLLVDFDTVEDGNLLRQNFCPAELGQPKALALASRYGTAWGIDLPAVLSPFSKELLPRGYSTTSHYTLLVGCVDNAAARRSLHELLADDEPVPHLLWLDAGNHVESGQVLLGNTAQPESLRHAFETPGGLHCARLPSPALQHPELLVPQLEEQPGVRLGCEQLAQLKAQSLTVNLAMASLLADYLLQLLITRDLRRFASYLDIPSGARRHRYNTPAQLAAAVSRNPAVFPDNDRPNPTASTLPSDTHPL